MKDEMSVDYCLVSKTLIEDRLVTPKAKAMYAVLCSRAEGFDCSNRNLADVLDIGNSTAAKLLKELEDYGYITKESSRKYRVHPHSIFEDGGG